MGNKKSLGSTYCTCTCVQEWRRMAQNVAIFFCEKPPQDLSKNASLSQGSAKVRPQVVTAQEMHTSWIQLQS